MNRRTASRLAWAGFAFYLAMGTLSQIVLWMARDITRASGWSGTSFTANLLLGTLMGTFPLVGSLIVSRRPDNRLGWVLVTIGSVVGVGQLAVAYDLWGLGLHPGSLPGAGIAATVDSASWVPMIGLMGIFVLLLFPDGHLPAPRWRWVAWVLGAGMSLAFLANLLNPGPLGGGNFPAIANPLGIQALRSVLKILVGAILVIPLGILASAVSVIGRYRRSRGVERLQMKWLVTAATMIAAVYAVTIVLSIFVFPTPLGGKPPSALAILQLASVMSFALLPISIGFAVLRYKLYEIDVIINKALVYGSLAVFISVVYVALVVGIGQLLRNEHSVVLSIAATAIVAVAFEPVRARVQRVANRLVYGKRATPYEVMAGFSRRMAETAAMAEVLPDMAETAARGVGAEHSRVRVLLPGGSERVETWPAGADPTGDAYGQTVEVSHRGERVGDISITKPAGEQITPAEGKLLTDLAAQAGLAMHNVRLAASLEARLAELDQQSAQLAVSRQRLVTARDAQRRGLERDIREGPQRQLTAIGQRLEEVEALAATAPSDAETLLGRLGEDANATLEGLRDLARGIFPPLLADKGVVAALDAHIRKIGANAHIEASRAFTGRRFDADTEACIYFCCLQALQNVLRHADNAPSIVTLDLAAEGISFTVRDEGPGFDAAVTEPGMGMQIMRDRVDALEGELDIRSAPGDGTVVTVHIPVSVAEPVA